jgi:hypothetical protein
MGATTSKGRGTRSCTICSSTWLGSSACAWPHGGEHLQGGYTAVTWRLQHVAWQQRMRLAPRRRYIITGDIYRSLIYRDILESIHIHSLLVSMRTVGMERLHGGYSIYSIFTRCW